MCVKLRYKDCEIGSPSVLLVETRDLLGLRHGYEDYVGAMFFENF